MSSPKPPSAEAACQDHPATPAAARCAACDRPICDACFRFRLGGRPACAPCAYEASTRPARRVSLAVAFLCVSAGGGLWLARRYDPQGEALDLLVVGGVTAIVIAIVLAASSRDSAKPALENRDPTDDPIDERALEGSASPYRARARRALLAASPRLSASATAVVVTASLAASAVLLPASLKLPRWIEAELVLAAWWVIVTATLAMLLHRGFRLRDDFVYFAPWNRPAAPADRSASKASSSGSGGSGGCADGCGSVDGDGCIAGIAVAIALAVAFGAAWVLVELVAPLTFFLTYWLFMRAIGRVANDRHGCEGDLSRSMGWGALWATAYVLPIAALTWALHALHR